MPHTVFINEASCISNFDCVKEVLPPRTHTSIGIDAGALHTTVGIVHLRPLDLQERLLSTRPKKHNYSDIQPNHDR